MNYSQLGSSKSSNEENTQYTIQGKEKLGIEEKQFRTYSEGRMI